MPDLGLVWRWGSGMKQARGTMLYAGLGQRGQGHQQRGRRDAAARGRAGRRPQRRADHRRHRLVAGYYLTELLSRFRRHSPAVKVQVTEETPQFLEHLLINGELDVAWAGTIRMKVKAMTNTATTLVTGRGRGRIKSCSIQIGSVVCWPAVKVVTITSSKLSAKASSAPAAAPSRVAAG